MNIEELEQLHYAVLCSILKEPEKNITYFCFKLGITQQLFFECLEFLVEEEYVRNVSFSKGGLGNKILIAYYNGVSVTGKGLNFMKQMEKQNADAMKPEKQRELLPTVFISYNWDNDDFADSIENSLNGHAVVCRDKDSVPNWGSLSEFMKSIRKQDFAVLIISKAYLESEACLFEVMQLMRDENWNEKAMYVVLPDAQIYNPLDRANHIKYWGNKCEEYANAIKSLPASSTAELNMVLREATMIRDNIGAFLAKVADTSNPNTNKVIQAIVSRVEDSGKAEAVSSGEESDHEKQHLSKEAAAILLTAASGDLGIIICTLTFSTYNISINHKDFVQLQFTQRREIAIWEESLEELITHGLIKRTHSGKDVFSVTTDGYHTADQYAARMNGEKILCSHCHYSGPTIESGICPICGSEVII